MGYKDLIPAWWTPDIQPSRWTPDIQPSRADKEGNLPPCPGTKNSLHAMV